MIVIAPTKLSSMVTMNIHNFFLSNIAFNLDNKWYIDTTSQIRVSIKQIDNLRYSKCGSRLKV